MLENLRFGRGKSSAEDPHAQGFEAFAKRFGGRARRIGILLRQKNDLRGVSGRFDVLRIVEQYQGLKRSGRRLTTGRTSLTTRRIEGEHARGRSGASPKGVHAAAIEPFALGLRVGLARPGLFPYSGGLIRHHARSSDFGDQQARNGQGRIADLFGRETVARAMEQELVVRIDRLPVRIAWNRRLTVGCRQDHLLAEPFDIPSARYKVAGQPIEQFGVRRHRALATEIFERSDNASGEEDRPPTIHRHAARQRVSIRDDPLGKFQPIGFGLRVGPFPGSRHSLRGMGFYTSSGSIVGAAFEDVRRAGDDRRSHGHDGSNR